MHHRALGWKPQNPVGATTPRGRNRLFRDTFYLGQESLRHLLCRPRGKPFQRLLNGRVAVHGRDELRNGIRNAADHVRKPGLRAGMVAGVIVNRTQQEIPNAETMEADRKQSRGENRGGSARRLISILSSEIKGRRVRPFILRSASQENPFKLGRLYSTILFWCGNTLMQGHCGYLES